MLRRLLQVITLSLLLWVPCFVAISPQPASAVNVFQACDVNGAQKTDVCQERSKHGNPVVRAIHVAINILSVIIGAAATIVIILSAFKMVRSQGNPQEVSTARTGIIYAAIGLVIAVMAPIIVGYVLKGI